jgi:hypothetical protein
MDSNLIYKILIEEYDPKKLAKAAKGFVKEMASTIFKEDIDLLEERVIKKSKSKMGHHAIMTDLEHENTRKILEKMSNKSTTEKINEMERRLKERFD